MNKGSFACVALVGFAGCRTQLDASLGDPASGRDLSLGDGAQGWSDGPRPSIDARPHDAPPPPASFDLATSDLAAVDLVTVDLATVELPFSDLAQFDAPPFELSPPAMDMAPLLGDARPPLSDGPPPRDLALCTQHKLLPVALTDLRLLDPGKPHLGAVLRLRLAVPLRPCDALGDVEVQVKTVNGTDYVGVTARTWQINVACGQATPQVRVVSLTAKGGVSSPHVVVLDGAPGATRLLMLDLDPAPGADCNAAVQPGDPCQLDCQCQLANGLSLCVLDGGGGGRCQIPCEEDSDCPGGRDACATLSDFTCHPPGMMSCLQACPFGQGCMRGGCRPAQTILGGTCRCNGECGFGRVCSEAGVCEIPCTTVGDCGRGGMCRGGACF